MANRKILVVEDEKPMSSALALKLTKAGFDVKNAYNGEEALDLISKEDFDLILLDIMMPKVDGFHVLEKLNENKIKTPVFMLSNLSQPDDEKRSKDLGAVGFFIKSNTPIKEIIERIKVFLN